MVVALIMMLPIVFCFLSPPFMSPDEVMHFFKAYQIALGGMVSEQAHGTAGYSLPLEVIALGREMFPIPPLDQVSRYDLAAVLDAFSMPPPGSETRFVGFPNMAPYAPTMYVPQALGILVGRIVEAPTIAQFYAGRVANALASSGLTVVALVLMPHRRWPVAVVTLQPTTMTILGSMSADAMIFAISFLVLSISLRSLHARPWRRTAVAGLPVLVMFLTLAKGVYMPVAAAGLSPDRWRQRQRLPLIIVSMVLGMLAFAAWVSFGKGAEITFSIISRVTLEPAMTARPADQLRVMLDDPGRFAAILASSFAERLPVYVVRFIAQFGHNTLVLWVPFYALSVGLIILTLAMPDRRAVPVAPLARAWMLAIALGGVILIETALYLTGTPLGAPYIQGTQGRYMIPYAPLALLSLTLGGAERCRGDWMIAVFVAGVLTLNGAALWTALNSYWISGFVRARGIAF